MSRFTASTPRFRAIPILGPIFVGRQGEGVVGITFAIKGKLDDPAVLVNPMSVMTPGIFRQIFEFGDAEPPGCCGCRLVLFEQRRLRPAGAITLQTGLISTCRFLPSESLITPSGVRSARVRNRFSSATDSSFTFSPPPLI